MLFPDFLVDIRVLLAQRLSINFAIKEACATPLWEECNDILVDNDLHQPWTRLTPNPVIRLRLIRWLIVLPRCYILELVVKTTLRFPFPYVGGKNCTWVCDMVNDVAECLCELPKARCRLHTRSPKLRSVLTVYACGQFRHNLACQKRTS